MIESADRVLRVLESFDPGERDVSLGEIAEIMGWTEAKARNLVYRGLGDLRARLSSIRVGGGVG